MQGDTELLQLKCCVRFNNTKEVNIRFILHSKGFKITGFLKKVQLWFLESTELPWSHWSALYSSPLHFIVDWS